MESLIEMAPALDLGELSGVFGTWVGYLAPVLLILPALSVVAYLVAGLRGIMAPPMEKLARGYERGGVEVVEGDAGYDGWDAYHSMLSDPSDEDVEG